MRLAEILARLGCTLVGWMLAYGLCLLLAVLPWTDCAEAGERFGRDTLLFASVTAIFVMTIPLGRKVAGLGTIMKGFTLPLLLLIPMAVQVVLPFLSASTFAGAHLCHVLDASVAAAPRPAWHVWWAPFQLLVLAGVVAAAISFWLPVHEEQAR